nr:unnamed protein product [Callosobruchus analis]
MIINFPIYMSRNDDHKTTVPTHVIGSLETRVKICHINVQGISNKLHQIEYMLDHLDVDVIATTEHHISYDNIRHFYIPQYKLASYFCRSNHKNGGVAIYMKSHINYRQHKFSHLSVEGHVEVCDSLSIVLRVGMVLTTANEKYDDIVLCGDFNIDYNAVCLDTMLLKDIFECFDLYVTTSDPTRIVTYTNGSKTSSAIDYLATNIDRSLCKTVIFNPNIADHFGHLFETKWFASSLNAKETVKLKFRNLGMNNINQFKTMVSQIDWHPLYQLELNDSYSYLIDSITWCLESSCPEKTKRHYRNNLVQAKKDYYAGIIRGSSNKSKAVWRVINYEIGRVKKSPDSIVLNIDSKAVSDETHLSNIFASTFSQGVPNGIKAHFSYNLSLPPTSPLHNDVSIFIRPVSKDDINDILLNIKNKNTSASQMLALLPDKAREIKLLKAVNYVTCYMYPDDQQSVVALEWKAPTTNQYYPTTAKLTGTSQGDPASLYWCAVIIQDRDGDTGDTVKFNNLAEVRRYTPRKSFRIGPETSIFKFTTIWTPQEPSEQEWLGMKSTGNASKVYKLYVLGSHLNPTGWASPNNTKKSRTIGIELDCVWHVVYRGRISTVSLPRVSTTCSSDADFEGTKNITMATSVELVEQSLQASESGLEETENLIVLSFNLETDSK